MLENDGIAPETYAVIFAERIYIVKIYAVTLNVCTSATRLHL